jgi:nicotinate-nucleotide adenylyltransferase
MSGPIIGLLGGAFDPVHNGHESVVTSMLGSGIIDELWIIPSYHPPHKLRENLASFHDRVKMLEIAFEENTHVRINRIEEHLAAPGYTFNTLVALQQEHPNFVFYWCIGSDNIPTFTKWYRYSDILKHWSLLVAERPEHQQQTLPEDVLSQCFFVKHDPLDISSTQIRQQLSANIQPDSIPVKVYEYIKTQNLYRV